MRIDFRSPIRDHPSKRRCLSFHPQNQSVEEYNIGNTAHLPISIALGSGRKAKRSGKYGWTLIAKRV